MKKAQEVTSQIRAAIQSGEFAPNQRLVEADLCERFDATRAVVRNAFVTLTAEGFVERLPNKGARVREVSRREAVEILDVRIALEPLLAAKAAERVASGEAAENDKAKLERLREIRDTLTTAVEQGDLLIYAQLHREQDNLIVALSGHQTATDILERVQAQAARHQFRLSLKPGRAPRSAPEHIAIIDAVLAGDAAAAEAQTKKHLQSVLNDMSEEG